MYFVFVYLYKCICIVYLHVWHPANKFLRSLYHYHSKTIAYFGQLPSKLYFCICLCIRVFACLTLRNIVFGVLLLRAFQKYSTCLVYNELLILGENQVLEGWGPFTFDQIKCDWKFTPHGEIFFTMRCTNTPNSVKVDFYTSKCKKKVKFNRKIVSLVGESFYTKGCKSVKVNFYTLWCNGQHSKEYP